MIFFHLGYRIKNHYEKLNVNPRNCELHLQIANTTKNEVFTSIYNLRKMTVA